MVDPTPLDDVEFLARSKHRVQVLESLRSGPRTRPDIHDELGISQPTLGRVLNALQDRNWVTHRGREYALSPFGELLAEEFAELLDTVEIIQELGDVVQLLPTERMEFDVRRFGGASVVKPKPNDVLAHVRRAETLLAGADHLRVLTPSIFPAALEGLLDRLDGQTPHRHEAILTDGAVEAVQADPTLVAATRALLEIDGVEVLRYDGAVPVILALVDDTAVIAPLDENDLPRAVIESKNETIRRWVEGELDEFRDASTQVTADDLQP